MVRGRANFLYWFDFNLVVSTMRRLFMLTCLILVGLLPAAEWGIAVGAEPVAGGAFQVHPGAV